MKTSSYFVAKGFVVALILFTASCFIGCGTINTVARGDYVTKRNLKKAKTYCESIPRVYSGVSYDFCRLNGEPNDTSLWGMYDSAPYVLLDFAFIAYISKKNSNTPLPFRH